MLKLWFGGVLAATLQVEVILAFPTGNNLEYTPRDRLIEYVAAEYADVANTLVEGTYSVFTKTLKKAEHLANREQLQPLLLELEGFITRVNDWRKKEGDESFVELFEIFELALNLDEKFSTDDKLDAQENILDLEKLLKKSGSESVVPTFSARMIKGTSHVIKATQKYISKLSFSEKAYDAQLIKWYEQIKDEEYSVIACKALGISFIYSFK